MSAQINGKPFTDTLGEITNGEFLQKLTQQQYEAVRAARETFKPASLTIKITYTPNGRSGVSIDAKVDTKLPEHDRPATTFFADEDGALVRDDPNQPKLPLHKVRDAEDEPARRVAD